MQTGVPSHLVTGLVVNLWDIKLLRNACGLLPNGIVVVFFFSAATRIAISGCSGLKVMYIQQLKLSSFTNLVLARPWALGFLLPPSRRQFVTDGDGLCSVISRRSRTKRPMCQRCKYRGAAFIRTEPPRLPVGSERKRLCRFSLLPAPHR